MTAQVKPSKQQQTAANNQWLLQQSAEERIAWSLANLPQNQVITSSFGIQSAVMLHMLTQQQPDIPVVVIDTGFLFDETYRFIDALTERLQLNLKVFQPKLSAAWLQARHGELWTQGIDGLDSYNKIVKVEPMQRAFEQLQVSTWYSGVRRSQASTREQAQVLALQNGRFKVHPIVDWSNRDVHQYLTRHDLPYHPLWDKGYVSVGDHHTSQPLRPGMTEEQTRFFGLKRECGIHQI